MLRSASPLNWSIRVASTWPEFAGSKIPRAPGAFKWNPALSDGGMGGTGHGSPCAPQALGRGWR